VVLIALREQREVCRLSVWRTHGNKLIAQNGIEQIPRELVISYAGKMAINAAGANRNDIGTAKFERLIGAGTRFDAKLCRMVSAFVVVPTSGLDAVYENPISLPVGVVVAAQR
jgi:hypothetical protein